MAKYFKLSGSVDAEPVQPVDVFSNEVTFSSKHLSWKRLLCAAVFIVLIALTLVFIALYAHEISKKKNACATPRLTGTSTTRIAILTAAG